MLLSYNNLDPPDDHQGFTPRITDAPHDLSRMSRTDAGKCDTLRPLRRACADLRGLQRDWHLPGLREPNNLTCDRLSRVTSVRPVWQEERMPEL